MIYTQTVFVLGAGASMPYGLPSGVGLLSKARELAKEGATSVKLRSYAKLASVGKSTIESFLRTLEDTLDGSLDAVLEHRSTDIGAIGKVVMAAILLDAERMSLKHSIDPSENWLPLLFAEMTRGANNLQDFSNNKAGIVTFNYDRLIENKFIKGLAQKYGGELAECAAAFEKIPIVHVHGYLGDLPCMKKKPSVPFGAGDCPKEHDPQGWVNQHISEAARKLVVVHEGTDDTDEFKSARNLLVNARRVVFLGFGFNEINLARLHPHEWNTTDVSATAFDLTESERNFNVNGGFARAGFAPSLGQQEWGCLKFLRNNLQLLRT